jgi:hypothetical protein
MLIENLAKDYVVSDKSASIRFKRPGKGIVCAHFELIRDEFRASLKPIAGTRLWFFWR